MNIDKLISDSDVSFGEYTSNKAMYEERLKKRMDFTLKRLKALKRARELREIAKNRVDNFNRDKAFTILKLTNKEKDEYIELVEKYKLGD